MRGRHVAELTAALRQAVAGGFARRARRNEVLARGLAQCDPRHRLGGVRARLIADDARLSRAAARRVHAVDARFKSLTARLDGLSPLAVLARGYAVAWDSTRTRILRDAATVSVGDEVIVKLERGELKSTVTSRT
jgi:exodeoxyribonuclease VII large subunit